MPTLIEGMLQKTSDRWMDCKDLPSVNLLRLAILRDLIHSIHSEKSRCLATGLKADVQLLKALEDQVENLRESATFQFKNDLRALLKGQTPLQKKSRIIPEALFRSFEREKLTRYDRKWEFAIAAEAFFLEWHLWKLEAWIQIPQLEAWDKTLHQKLWPDGLVLFTESATPPESGPELIDSTTDSPLWKGRWIILFHPRIKNIDDLVLNLIKWPGFSLEVPSPPLWKQIYPPFYSTHNYSHNPS